MEFIVSEENKAVICKLWNCSYAALNRIYRYTNAIVEDEDKYLINNVYVGVATCSNGEEFDFEYGKNLALERARYNKQRAINNIIKQFIVDTRSALEELESEEIKPLKHKYLG